MLFTAADLDGWCQELSTDLIVLRCRTHPSAALCGTVREFLVESLLAEKVRNLSALGLVVPSGFVVDAFLRMLSVLPENPVQRQRAESLRKSASSCKKWCRRFRETWSLQWGGTSVPHGVSPVAAQSRAAIYLRWVQWFNHWGADREVVVVNEDETMLGAVQLAKAGMTDCGSSAARSTVAAPSREAALPRTSLIASICSDPEVQKCLPQIRLPRTKNGQVPSKPTLDNYAAAGTSQITWHGSAGFASGRILLWYLSRVAKAVRAARPGAAILLVWDCCPVHICQNVLAAAKRLRIGVVIVPGRMTWALQPLDTHVFAVLKNCTRRKIFEAKAKDGRSTLPPSVCIRIHGDAVRETLVEPWLGERHEENGAVPRSLEFALRCEGAPRRSEHRGRLPDSGRVDGHPGCQRDPCCGVAACADARSAASCRGCCRGRRCGRGSRCGACPCSPAARSRAEASCAEHPCAAAFGTRRSPAP